MFDCTYPLHQNYMSTGLPLYLFRTVLRGLWETVSWVTILSPAQIRFSISFLDWLMFNLLTSSVLLECQVWAKHKGLSNEWHSPREGHKNVLRLDTGCSNVFTGNRQEHWSRRKCVQEAWQLTLPWAHSHWPQAGHCPSRFFILMI